MPRRPRIMSVVPFGEIYVEEISRCWWYGHVVFHDKTLERHVYSLFAKTKRKNSRFDNTEAPRSSGDAVFSVRWVVVVSLRAVRALRRCQVSNGVVAEMRCCGIS